MITLRNLIFFSFNKKTEAILFS